MAELEIGVLGAGTWGTALANLLAGKGYHVDAWSALPEDTEYMATHREHKNLPGVPISENITFTANMELAASGKDLVVFSSPSQYVRSTAAKARPYLAEGQLCASVAKGIERKTFCTMSDIIAEELNGLSPRIVALTGPTFAHEVALGMISCILAASTDAEAAREVQEIFGTGWMRVYTSDDPHGAEICGALKNIIALASGVATGLGCGDNARAALITRGLAEIKRLGLAMGCKESTFYGLAGTGDLILTCTSTQSRNTRAGILIGQGRTAQEACDEVGMVVEGLNVLPAALELSLAYSVEMPITQALAAVVSGSIPASDIIDILYARQQKPE